jgi:hypothetical protein
MGRGGAGTTRRLITLISMGWLPPDWCPSGACLNLGASEPLEQATDFAKQVIEVSADAGLWHVALRAVSPNYPGDLDS